MEEKYITLVRVYTYKGHRYAIVQGLHDMIIRAVDYNYLDDEGKLIKPLNGIEMLCRKDANTVPAIIERINNKVDCDEFIEENGISRNDEDAFLKAVVEFYGKRARYDRQR